jgi:hypothetical protein
MLKTNIPFWCFSILLVVDLQSLFFASVRVGGPAIKLAVYFCPNDFFMHALFDMGVTMLSPKYIWKKIQEVSPLYSDLCLLTID